MNRVQKSGPGSSVRSSDSATCTPRMRARWSARSRWRPIRVNDVAARLSIAFHLGRLTIVLCHHPRVAAAATLGAVDDERSRSERHAGQAAGGDVDIGPGEDERAEVLMRTPKLAAVEDRLDRQGHDRLG